jgi:hypothetical protein
LRQETFPPWTHMTDENPCLRTIKSGQSRLDQLSHLQDGSPHGTLSPSNRRPSLPIIKQLVHDNCSTQTQQTQLESPYLEETTIVFVHNVKIIDVILRGTKLFQYTDIFTGSPGGVDGDVKGVGFVEEEGEFREDGFGMFLDGRFQMVVRVGSSELSAHVAGDEGTVLNDVFECSTTALTSRILWDGSYFSFILSKESSS